MEQELYLLIPWSEARELMERKGFMENTYPKVLDEYGYEAYFVKKSWYDTNNYNDYCNLATNQI